MHAAAALAAISDTRQCGECFEAIFCRLRAAVGEAETASFPGQSSEVPEGMKAPLDFRSLPAMREQLQLALERLAALRG